MDAALQFAQVDKEFKPCILKLFTQARSTIKLDLREFVLLDSQSTMDLLCNASLVSKTSKSSSIMRLNINVGTMVVSHRATIPGYNTTVWFSTRAITNIINLISLIDQYRVIYDGDDLMFEFHRELDNKPNIEFIMHESGLHYYYPRKEQHLTFVNAVSENNQGFTKRQIKAEKSDFSGCMWRKAGRKGKS
jgi:hypothetical protein